MFVVPGFVDEIAGSRFHLVVQASGSNNPIHRRPIEPKVHDALNVWVHGGQDEVFVAVLNSSGCGPGLEELWPVSCCVQKSYLQKLDLLL